jgi:hypothetical protein
VNDQKLGVAAMTSKGPTLTNRSNDTHLIVALWFLLILRISHGHAETVAADCNSAISADVDFVGVRAVRFSVRCPLALFATEKKKVGRFSRPTPYSSSEL